MREYPISDFIRPSKKKLKKTKHMINTKERRFGGDCVDGCKCEERSEDFPILNPSSEDPGLPEAAMWGYGKGHKDSLAKSEALTGMPARSEAAMWGHDKSHKGSLASTRAEVELKNVAIARGQLHQSPRLPEAAMWGHDKSHKGSLAEVRTSRWGTRKAVRFADAVDTKGEDRQNVSRQAACTNSLASSDPFLRGKSGIRTDQPSLASSDAFLRGKSDIRTDQPISRDRKQINPSPLQSPTPPEWTKLIPQLLEDCKDLNAEQAMSRLRDIITKAS